MAVKVISSGASESDLLISALQKKHGESIGGLGAKYRKIRRIKTGIFPLDLSLGGGFPRSRMCVVFGPEGSGKTNLGLLCCAYTQKHCAVCDHLHESCVCPDGPTVQRAVMVDLEHCVSYDSRFMDSATGQVYTAQEVYDKKLPLTVRSYDHFTGKVLHLPISHWVDNGVKTVISVKTSSTEVKATENHRFWVKKEKHGRCDWVRADELEVGDFVASPNIDKKWEWGTESSVTESEARFIGLMLGDGCTSTGGSPTFSNVDKDVIADMRGIIESWGCNMTTYRPDQHRLIGKGHRSKWDPANAVTLMKKVGLWGVTRADKFIPIDIFCSSKEVALACLTGLYMTDGTVSTVRPSLVLSNISLTLIEQTRELWRRLGVPSTIHKCKMYQPHHAQQYMLTINTIKVLKKVFSLMPLYGKKSVLLGQWADKAPSANCGHAMSDFKGPLTWSKVRSVDVVDPVQTYDFTIMGTHNYAVNDIIAHNTYDPLWGRMLGIDNEKLILLQPEYAEQAADIVGDVLHAADVGICVLDSIAAMTTSAMVENSVEKAEVGGSALVMTKFMKKVTVALAHESKRNHMPLLLCINQIRMKIGVMFGSPEVMPGGNAFRFASSMTLRIHGKDKFDKEISQTMPIYKETTAALNRWKVPVTSKTCEYDLCVLPHDGIPAGYVDDWNTVSNFLKGYGALGKDDSGGWFCVTSDGELEEFKTLTAIRQKYNEDQAFNEYLKSIIVAHEMQRYSLKEGDAFDAT